MKNVPEILREGADTYEERNKLYGDNYKRHGSVMEALFPNGVKLNNIDDHNRFGLLTQKVAKLTRYCQNFEHGGHMDSLHDDMVYTGMLLEIDGELAEDRELMAEGKVMMSGSGEPLVVDWSKVFEPDASPVPEPSATADQMPELSEAELVDAIQAFGEQPSEEPPVVIPEPPVQK